MIVGKDAHGNPLKVGDKIKRIEREFNEFCKPGTICYITGIRFDRRITISTSNNGFFSHLFVKIESRKKQVPGCKTQSRAVGINYYFL
jgi:hypothetical protein